ncbi:hypothetical protein GIW70_08265 [Pseudomonas syringae]|nr:hypothetical protein [Pseudomonas syringae]MCF5068191.1 hypothetical protein [Pseudomonas syringae]
MSTIHDQAMNYVYQQVLQRLLSFFSRAERTALQLLIQRLVVAAGGTERIGDFKVLVIQSGTRDSCYALALLRAAQLSIAGRAPGTFQLRVANLRGAGTATTALHNMHRSYSALFLYDDPRVELLMVDHREVLSFNHLAAFSDEGNEASRLNLLTMGHRRNWDEKLELWDHTYLATAEFYGQIARWNNGVDALLGSEGPRRQNAFLQGLDRATQKAGLGALRSHNGGFEELFVLLDGLGGDCFRMFYPEADLAPWRPAGQFEACRRSTCIDIHDIVAGDLKERWPLLSDFLGFQAQEFAQDLTDSELADPLIAGHLCGLQASLIEGRTYQAGVSDYLQRSVDELRRNLVPEPVCERLLTTFGYLRDFDELRLRAAAALQAGYGVSETQLTCLIHAPFIDGGAGLERFLRSCHPGMLVALPDLHRAMQGLHAPDQVLHWMTDVSGLPVKLITRLYGMGPVRIRHEPDALSLGEASDDGEFDNAGAAPGDRSAEG